MFWNSILIHHSNSIFLFAHMIIFLIIQGHAIFEREKLYHDRVIGNHNSWYFLYFQCEKEWILFLIDGSKNKYTLSLLVFVLSLTKATRQNILQRQKNMSANFSIPKLMIMLQILVPKYFFLLTNHICHAANIVKKLQGTFIYRFLLLASKSKNNIIRTTVSFSNQFLS